MLRALFTPLRLTMKSPPVKPSKRKFYAVRRGRRTGIFESWDETRRQVDRFEGCEHKSFATRDEAERYLRGELQGQTLAREVRPALARQTARQATQVPPSIPSSSSTPTPTTTTTSSSSTTIHIDGSALSNGSHNPRAGIGVFFSLSDPRNLSEPLPSHLGPHTNNRAELYAAYRALEITKDAGHQKIVLKTDSKYTIQIFTEWLEGWKSRGMKRADGKPVENVDVITMVERLIDEHRSNGTQVHWEWVRGHANDPGNEAADALAKGGAIWAGRP